MRAPRSLIVLVGLSLLTTKVEAQAPSHLWGSFGSAPGLFNAPIGVAVSSSGRVYVCDQLNHRVQYFTVSGEYLGEFSGQPAPYYIAVGPDGSVYMSGSRLVVQKFSAEGTFIREWGGEQAPGTGFGQYTSLALAVELDGDVLVLDSSNRRVCRFTSEGKFLTQLEGMSPEATSIAVNHRSEFYCGSHGNFGYVVDKYSELGEHLGTIYPPFAINMPPGLATDKDDNLYFVEHQLDRVLKFSTFGSFVAAWGTHGSAPGQFDTPAAVAVDEAGRVFIADLDNHRIQVFDGTTPATHATWGRLKAAYRE